MPLVGFRSEDLYGEGYRNLKEVARHEIKELNNGDIVDTLSKLFGHTLSEDEALAHIADLYDQGFKECIWICDSVQDFLDEYDIEDDDGKMRVYEMMRYEFRDGEYIIISDMGSVGKLVAYRGRPIIIPAGTVSRSDPHGVLFNGWASPAWAKKLHYFVDGISLCMKYQHFTHQIPPSPKPFPLHYFCKICMRLLCDKIIIAGIPVDIAPIRAYVRHYRKYHGDVDVSLLRDKLLLTADFGGDSEKFGQELDDILARVFACPKCYVSIDREGSCTECERFTSVKDNLNTLEKIADWTRRT